MALWPHIYIQPPKLPYNSHPRAPGSPYPRRSLDIALWPHLPCRGARKHQQRGRGNGEPCSSSPHHTPPPPGPGCNPPTWLAKRKHKELTAKAEMERGGGRSDLWEKGKVTEQRILGVVVVLLPGTSLLLAKGVFLSSSLAFLLRSTGQGRACGFCKEEQHLLAM